MCRNQSASSGEGEGAVGGQHGPRQGPNMPPARTHSTHQKHAAGSPPEPNRARTRPNKSSRVALDVSQPIRFLGRRPGGRGRPAWAPAGSKHGPRPHTKQPLPLTTAPCTGLGHGTPPPEARGDHSYTVRSHKQPQKSSAAVALSASLACAGNKGGAGKGRQKSTFIPKAMKRVQLIHCLRGEV